MWASGVLVKGIVGKGGYGYREYGLGGFGLWVVGGYFKNKCTGASGFV